MSIEPRALPTAAMAPEAPESIATLDLFALGRRAAAARDGRLGPRGSFVRARQLLANGSWRGPRDAAESYLDDADLAAIGGLSAAAAAGVDLLVAGAFSAEVQAAAEAGIRVLLRLPYRVGESDGERTSRLTVVGGIGWNVGGVMPAPAGAPEGLCWPTWVPWGHASPRWCSGSGPTSSTRRSSPSAPCAWAPTPTTRR